MDSHAVSDEKPPNSAEDSSRWARFVRLLYPGTGLKRWLLFWALGVAISSIGVAFLLRKLFALTFPNFLPSYLEGVLLLAVGVAFILLSIYGLYRSVGPLVFAPATIGGLADTIYTRHSRGRGPRIVAIGGGTGLSVLLRGLKTYTDNLTAIITVSDDGGSSGRLRQELGVPPPGDFRNCLIAMSDAERLVTELFQHRFDGGNGLKGHSFGNLFLVAMADITGSFERALYESSRVLAVRGRILPATTESTTLVVRMKDGAIIHGETSITGYGGQVDRLMIAPSDAQASPMAEDAIRQAHLIVIGPGSLYTSILPNLLVPGIARAVRESRAVKMFICNVSTEKGETDTFTVQDHFEALQKHTFPTIVEYVVANSRLPELGSEYLGQPVVIENTPLKHARLEKNDLVDMKRPVRHDSAKLARVIMDIYQSKR